MRASSSLAPGTTIQKTPNGVFFRYKNGPRNETRTHNPLQEADFESAAYTNSAIRGLPDYSILFSENPLSDSLKERIFVLRQLHIFRRFLLNFFLRLSVLGNRRNLLRRNQQPLLACP